MCDWHTALRPKHNTAPLVELPTRFGAGTRLIALKTFTVPDGQDLSSVRELEV